MKLFFQTAIFAVFYIYQTFRWIQRKRFRPVFGSCLPFLELFSKGSSHIHGCCRPDYNYFPAINDSELAPCTSDFLELHVSFFLPSCFHHVCIAMLTKYCNPAQINCEVEMKQKGEEFFKKSEEGK